MKDNGPGEKMSAIYIPLLLFPPQRPILAWRSVCIVPVTLSDLMVTSSRMPMRCWRSSSKVRLHLIPQDVTESEIFRTLLRHILLFFTFLILFWVTTRIDLHAWMLKKDIRFFRLSSAAVLYSVWNAPVSLRTPSWVPSLLWLVSSHMPDAAPLTTTAAAVPN